MSELQPLSATERAFLAELQARDRAADGDKTGQTKKREVQPRRKRKTGKVDFLDAGELRTLFRSIDDPRDRALFEVAFKRGLRAAEVGLIEFDHLRLAQKRLYVTRVKNGNSGEYVITDAEVKALRGYLKDRGTKPGPLFLSRNNKPISRRRLDELMKEYGGKAGLPAEKQHFHVMRHSCAMMLGEMGLDAADIQDWLGHVDIRNTMVYFKVSHKRRTATGVSVQSKDWY